MTTMALSTPAYYISQSNSNTLSEQPSGDQEECLFMLSVTFEHGLHKHFSGVHVVIVASEKDVKAQPDIFKDLVSGSMSSKHAFQRGKLRTTLTLS